MTPRKTKVVSREYHRRECISAFILGTMLGALATIALGLFMRYLVG